MSKEETNHLLSTENEKEPTSQEELYCSYKIEEGDVEPWYAARFSNVHYRTVADHLKEKNIHFFIPMHYVETLDRKGKLTNTLRPVIKNLLFIKKTMDEKQLREMLNDAFFTIYLLFKNKEDNHYYEIPSREMFEFITMCNPEIAMRKYISSEEAKLKPGMPVRVFIGPLKGLTGRLVRSNKKYYLLKTVSDIGVMLKVSRWCCKPDTSSKL